MNESSILFVGLDVRRDGIDLATARQSGREAPPARIGANDVPLSFLLG